MRKAARAPAARMRSRDSCREIREDRTVGSGRRVQAVREERVGLNERAKAWYTARRTFSVSSAVGLVLEDMVRTGWACESESGFS